MSVLSRASSVHVRVCARPCVCIGRRSNVRVVPCIVCARPCVCGMCVCVCVGGGVMCVLSRALPVYVCVCA